MKLYIKKIVLVAMALCHGLLFAVIPGTPFSCCPDICVDFSNLTPGDGTAAINAGIPGIMFSTTNPQGLVIFNSTNPTCNQFALGSPNKAFGGNGIGSGGAMGPCVNNKSLGNVLVMQSPNCLPNPGAISQGGTITIVFDCPVILDQVCALNVCDNASTIKMFDVNNALLNTKAFAACGTNGFQELMLSQPNVKKLEVFFNGQSALTCICFRCEVVDEAARSCCETLSSIVSNLVTCCDQNTSIISTLESRVANLETCCEENSSAIATLQTCCDANTKEISILDLCCVNAQSRLEQLECLRCCPEICLTFDKFNSGATQADINNGLCGITIAGIGNNCPGCQAMIYDTLNPDIPFSNPGTKTLIVSNGTPLVSNQTGATLTFSFDCPVAIDTVRAFDWDGNGNTITLKDAANNTLKVVTVDQTPEDQLVDVVVDQTGVSTMVIQLTQSGGIANVCFHCEVIDRAARSCCDQATSRIAILETCCDTVSSIINTLETRVAGLETCCDVNTLCCSLVEREIINLISEVDTNTTNINDLQSCCDQNNSRIANLETCCDSNTSRIAQLETCCDQAISRLDVLEFPNCCPFCLDFNLVNLQPGDTQATINSKLHGIQITAVGFNGGGAMIYDSSSFTLTNHADLGTPNDKHGGPGQEENNFDTNNVARGNVLIINDNVPPIKQSADLRGGSITFTFTCAVMVDSMGILDIEVEDQPADITLYDPNNTLIAVIPIPTLHDNGFQNVAINTPNVKTMVVRYAGQAAITDLCYHCEVIDLAARSCCEFLSSIVDNFGTRIENLESCCEGNSTRIENLQSCCDNHETRIENLESCCDEARSRLDRLERIDCCPTCFCIDFEQFNAGDTVDTINAKVGPFVTFSSSSESENAGPLIIFDSAHPSCDQTFLGSPNNDFGGPGIGAGGFAGMPGENSQNLGNIVVINDNRCSPSAVSEGGIITVAFACPVILCEAGFLNICGGNQCPSDFVELQDSTGVVISTIPLQLYGANSFQEITPNQVGVSKMVVHISGPTALTSICFRCEVIDEAARSCCEMLTSRIDQIIEEGEQGLCVLLQDIQDLKSCCDQTNSRIDQLVEEGSQGLCTVLQDIQDLQSCCELVSSRLDCLDSSLFGSCRAMVIDRINYSELVFTANYMDQYFIGANKSMIKAQPIGIPIHADLSRNHIGSKQMISALVMDAPGVQLQTSNISIAFGMPKDFDSSSSCEIDIHFFTTEPEKIFSSGVVNISLQADFVENGFEESKVGGKFSLSHVAQVPVTDALAGNVKHYMVTIPLEGLNIAPQSLAIITLNREAGKDTYYNSILVPSVVFRYRKGALN